MSLIPSWSSNQINPASARPPVFEQTRSAPVTSRPEETLPGPAQKVSPRLHQSNHFDAIRFGGFLSGLHHWMEVKTFKKEDIQRLQVQALEVIIREAASLQKKRHPFANMKADEAAILNYEFTLEDVLRLLPGRYDISIPQTLTRYGMIFTDLDAHMLHNRYWARSALGPTFTLTPKALKAMSFDPETMKTPFSEVNMNPVQDPVLGILQAIVNYDTQAKKENERWYSFIRTHTNFTNPISGDLGNINAQMDTPQIIHFRDYTRQMEEDKLLEIHAVDDGSDWDSYTVYVLTDLAMQRLQQATSTKQSN